MKIVTVRDLLFSRFVIWAFFPTFFYHDYDKNFLLRVGGGCLSKSKKLVQIIDILTFLTAG